MSWTACDALNISSLDKEVFEIIQSLVGDLTEEDTKILIERLKKEREDDE